MSRVLFPLIAIFLLGAAGNARAADDVKTILTKATAAHGGEEELNKYTASRTKTKGTLNLPGAGELEFTQEVAAMIPDKVREVMELTVNNQKVNVTTIMNGDQISINANGMDVPINDGIKNAVKNARHVGKISRFWTLLKDKNYDLSVVGETKVEGKKTVAILVSRKDHRDVTLHFDAETGLLAKVEHRTVDPMTDKEFTEERIVIEYTKKEGSRPKPKKSLVKRDGEKFMEAEILELTELESIDDSEFKK